MSATITESCQCGATFEMTGPYGNTIAGWAKEWRETHQHTAPETTEPSDSLPEDEAPSMCPICFSPVRDVRRKFGRNLASCQNPWHDQRTPDRPDSGLPKR